VGVVLVAPEPPLVEWHALYPSARNVSPKVRAFLAVLEERFEASILGTLAAS
jgi:DNA-binding transcriptional LysR family regulator